MSDLPQHFDLLGRVVLKDGINYTVTSTEHRGRRERVFVWNPFEQKTIIFETRAVFENWAYGTPVAANEGTPDAD